MLVEDPFLLLYCKELRRSHFFGAQLKTANPGDAKLNRSKRAVQLMLFPNLHFRANRMWISPRVCSVNIGDCAPAFDHWQAFSRRLAKEPPSKHAHLYWLPLTVQPERLVEQLNRSVQTPELAARVKLGLTQIGADARVASLQSQKGNLGSNDNNFQAKASAIIAIGVCLVYLAFFPALINSIDGNSMLAVSESLVTGKGFTVPLVPGLGRIGRGGAYYSIWYPLLSIIALPMTAVGVFISHQLGLPQHYVAGIFALVLSPIITAMTAFLVAMLAARLGATTAGALLAALGFAFGTIALTYSRQFYADPLLSLLTAAGIYFTFSDDSRERSAAVAATLLAVLAKPTGIVLGPCLGAYLLCTGKSFSKWIAPIAGTAGGLLIYCVYNWVRFGHVLDFGLRPPDRFTLSVAPSALAGLLFSPGRGLPWYCPAVIAVAAVPAAILMRWRSALILTIAAAYLAEYSVCTMWAGGDSWGPRLLLPVLPGLMALAGQIEQRRRWVLVALTAAGFAINAPNLISFYEGYYQEANAAGVSEQARLWDPRYAPLVRIWDASWHETVDAIRNADNVRALVHQSGAFTNDEIVQPVGTKVSVASVKNPRALKIINLWWWMLPAVRIPRAVGAAFSLILLLVGIWLIAGALALARDDVRVAHS